MVVMESNGQTPLDAAAFTPKELVMGVGATVVLFFSVLLFPVLGLFVSVLSPLPTLIATYRWPLALALRVPLGALVIVGVAVTALGTVGSIVYLTELLLLGYLMGTSARAGKPLEIVVGRACAVVFVLGAAVFWYTHSGHEGGMFAGLEEDLRANLRALGDIYPGAGGGKQTVDEISRTAVPLLVRLMPGGVLASLLLMAWFNLHMLRRYCQVNKLVPPGPADWSRWESPQPLVWGVVAGLILVLTPGATWFVGFNLLIVLSTVYLLQGLAVAGFYFNRWRVPAFLRAFAYMFIFFQLFVTLAVVLLGLFDLWFDFRGLHKPEQPPEDEY